VIPFKQHGTQGTEATCPHALFQPAGTFSAVQSDGLRSPRLFYSSGSIPRSEQQGNQAVLPSLKIWSARLSCFANALFTTHTSCAGPDVRSAICERSICVHSVTAPLLQYFHLVQPTAPHPLRGCLISLMRAVLMRTTARSIAGPLARTCTVHSQDIPIRMVRVCIELGEV
jgi:hypothetical protein